jgi:cation-transporting ATPase 13A1
MLLVFEATVVKSRLKNMTSLRQMASRPPQNIYVYRKRAWKLVPTSELLPGDLCSLVRTREDEAGKSPEGGQICPADMLLLTGGLVANEAMLTGESTPHHKEAAQTRTSAPTDAPLDLRNDKLHIVFGGTQIMQHTPSNHKFNGVSPAPDKGCLAYVLRTGFDTSQGRLMRTILFSSERVTADTWESLVFILFLLVFALAAAGYVLNEGLKDTTRSR